MMIFTCQQTRTSLFRHSDHFQHHHFPPPLSITTFHHHFTIMPPTNKTRDGRAEGHEKGLRAKVRPLNLFLHFPAQTPPPSPKTHAHANMMIKCQERQERNRTSQQRGSGCPDWGWKGEHARYVSMYLFSTFLIIVFIPGSLPP